MPAPLVVIFHQPPRPGDPPLTALLARAREALVGHHAARFERAGGRVAVFAGRAAAPGGGAAQRSGAAQGSGESFGERLARLVREERPDAGGLVVLGAGAVPLLRAADARRLVDVAASGEPVALTNNRYSSDVCAVGRAAILAGLPPLPSDNALPRWLEECAGVTVGELPGRDRLALDLDTPLDLALLARVPGVPGVLRRAALREGVTVPRLDELRAIAADPGAELLVAGRSGSRTLGWLERSVRCRVRFLAEERGLRASSDLATGAAPGATVRGARPPRVPRTTLGRLLDLRGPDALGAIVGELADAALLDTRVLLADRLGADEGAWPSAEDRFAADLLLFDAIADPWLRALTAASAGSVAPILGGGHTLVGPGVRWLLR